MQRHVVVLSHLREMGYDAATGTLEILFYRGGIYQYARVSAHIHTALMAAASKGRYFATMINDRYPTSHVG